MYKKSSTFSGVPIYNYEYTTTHPYPITLCTLAHAYTQPYLAMQMKKSNYQAPHAKSANARSCTGNTMKIISSF